MEKFEAVIEADPTAQEFPEISNSYTATGSEKGKYLLIAAGIIIFILVIIGVLFGGPIISQLQGNNKTQQVQKALTDTDLKVQLQEVSYLVHSYFISNGRYPQNLTLLGMKSEISGKPITYTASESGFTLSVKLSDGSEFKIER